MRLSEGGMPRVRVNVGSQCSLLVVEDEVFGAILGKNVMIINLFTGYISCT